MPEVEHLLKMISEHPKDLIIAEGIAEDGEQFVEVPYKIRGCYLSVVERMNEEFHKVLKGCDAHRWDFYSYFLLFLDFEGLDLTLFLSENCSNFYIALEITGSSNSLWDIPD